MNRKYKELGLMTVPSFRKDSLLHTNLCQAIVPVHNIACKNKNADKLSQVEHNPCADLTRLAGVRSTWPGALLSHSVE